MRPLTVICLGFLLGIHAQARPVSPVAPEELGAAAEIVVNGRVESIKLTDQRSELRLGETVPMPVRFAEAKITTLSASKGEPGPEFLFRFPQVDAERWPQPITTGPILTNLEEGKRYRFYLKNKSGVFVGVLNGAFDDGYAVQPLADKENNESQPILKEEAVALATAEFQKVRPKARIHTTIAEFFSFTGVEWRVAFYSDPPLSYPSFTSEAEIRIDGSRQILPASWIGTEKPRTGNKLVEKDKGRPVRLTVEGRPTHKGFEPIKGSIVDLVGTIHRIEKHFVSGTFTSPAFPSKEPMMLTFPTAALRSVQRLAERE